MRYGKCGSSNVFRAFLLLTTACAASAAMAQNSSGPEASVPAPSGASAENAEPGPQDIIVTGRRRSESAFNAPVAVSVLTSGAIESSGVARPVDVTRFVPNMNITSVGRAGENFVTLRGLAQARSADSIVAVIVDGVQLASAEELSQELFDIQQIEVLKGPQGALYGRNAIAGAIVIKTKPPSDNFETSATIGYGNGNAFKALGSVNIPIAKDGVYLRAGAFQTSRDGYFFDRTTQRDVDPANERGVRARLDIVAIPNLSVSLRGSMSRFIGAGINYHAQLGALDTNDASQPFVTNVIGRDRQRKRSASGVFDYDLGSGHVVFTPAYSYVHESVYGDGFPYAATADTTQRIEFVVRTKSAELKYISPQDRAFSYIVGGYWASIFRRDTTTQGIDTGQGVIDGRGPFPAGSINPTLSIQDDGYRYRVLAGFGQANLKLGERVNLSGAIRYDDERRRQTNLSPPSFSQYSGQVRRKTFKGIEPKVTLSYQPSSFVNVYADYGQGFVSGGFNPAQTRDLVVAADPNATVPNEYGKQINRAAEIGVKLRLFDNRVTVNAAAFHSKVRNLQQFQFFPAATLQAINPIDKTKIDGAEFDTTTRLGPVTIFAGAGYTNARIAAYSANKSYLGNKVPGVPKYTINAGAQYDVTLGSDLSANARIDYQRIGPQWFDIANTFGTRRSAVNLFDARINLVHDRWTFSVFSKNIFDKRYNAEAVVIFPTAQAVTPALPRTFGAELKVAFK